MATTKIVLERAGYTVIEAESGAECLEKLKKNQPDLILLDVMLPDESGWGRVQKDQKRWENKGHFSCYVYCAHKRGSCGKKPKVCRCPNLESPLE